MSLLRLDHVVIAVADLERAIGLCTQAGLTVVPGGCHPGDVLLEGARVRLVQDGARVRDEGPCGVDLRHEDGVRALAVGP
jgi:hypothetical protein